MTPVVLPSKAEFVTRALAAIDCGEVTGGDCYYTAPCIIGSVMSVEDRQALADDGNDNKPIGHLITDGRVKLPADGSLDVEWLILLQQIHDTAGSGCIEKLRAILAGVVPMYVLVRNEDGAFVAPPGSIKSYTHSIQHARRFDTIEAAEAERCGNESPRHLLSLFN